MPSCFEVYYNSIEPYNSEIKNAWIQWEVPLILGVIFIFDLIVMGIMLLAFSIGKNKGTVDIKSSGTGDGGISVH